jgi:cyclase
VLKTRVIPVILWDGMNCVQTVQFGRPARVFGSLMDAVQVYERRNIDELILLDIATNEIWGPRFDAVMEYTKELFCPVTIGGGISELVHIERALRSGADKVAIRKGCLNQQFLFAATQKFGAQAIVAAVDVRHDGNVIFDSTWNAPFKDSISAAEWAHTMELFGVGEILLTSIARNGTMTGYDLELVDQVSSAVDIPVIANGGCDTPKHMLEAIKAGAHAVAASTMFLFTDYTPRDCSRYLADCGIAARVT